MVKVVFDTNVLVSSIFWKGKPYQVVRKAAKAEFRNFVSNEMLAELEEVLHRDFEIDSAGIARITSTLLLFSSVLKPVVKHEIVADDPDDNIIIDCAVAAKARFIVTQDKHLLKIRRFKSINIVTPDEIMNIFE